VPSGKGVIGFYQPSDANALRHAPTWRTVWRVRNLFSKRAAGSNAGFARNWCSTEMSGEKKAPKLGAFDMKRELRRCI